MNKIFFTKIFCLLTLVFLISCSSTGILATAASVDFPVLVGPVKHIGGKPEKNKESAIAPIQAEVFTTVSVGSSTQSTTVAVPDYEVTLTQQTTYGSSTYFDAINGNIMLAAKNVEHPVAYIGDIYSGNTYFAILGPGAFFLTTSSSIAVDGFIGEKEDKKGDTDEK